MSGYTIGLIIEGVVALALIVAIVAVAINKRKPAKKKVPELNGLSGYIGAGTRAEHIRVRRTGVRTAARAGAVRRARTEHIRVRRTGV